MPEMATGLTNLLIIVSALWCLSFLPVHVELRLWRLFFCCVLLTAACGVVVHCLVLPEAAEQAIWALFALAMGPLLASLVAAAYRDVRGWLPAWISVLLSALAVVTSLGLVLLLLKFGFRAQFPLAAAMAIASVTAYMILQLLGWRSRGRTPAGLIGPLLILSFGFTWLLADFTTNIGPIQLTPAGWLHLGLALALPFIAKAAGPWR